MLTYADLMVLAFSPIMVVTYIFVSLCWGIIIGVGWEARRWRRSAHPWFRKPVSSDGKFYYALPEDEYNRLKILHLRYSPYLDRFGVCAREP